MDSPNSSAGLARRRALVWVSLFVAVLAAGMFVDGDWTKLDVVFVVAGVAITLGAWLIREPWSSISMLVGTVVVAWPHLVHSWLPLPVAVVLVTAGALSVGFFTLLALAPALGWQRPRGVKHARTSPRQVPSRGRHADDSTTI